MTGQLSVTETRTAIFQTPLAIEERALGARMGEFTGVTLPEGFSSFEEEYRAARQTVALFDTSWHVNANFTGRDRVKYLHAITSANLKDLPEGRGVLALLLSPQGRILAELELYVLPERVLVRSHVSLRDQTLATLKKYILGSQVKLEDITEATGSFAIEGPRAADLVRKVCGVGLESVPEMGGAEISVDGVPCQLIRRSHFKLPGAEILGARDSVAALWRAFVEAVCEQGGAPIGMAALNSLRLEAHVPWFPVDFNDSAIPHEAAVEETHISYNKGCYTGQEIVERVRSRGQVNRKRASLRFSSAEPPLTGTKLTAGGADVGAITSAAYSPASGSAIGMGYLRREHNSPGSVVEYEGGTATVTG
jgi:folate-binding protein YgfZ